MGFFSFLLLVYAAGSAWRQYLAWQQKQRFLENPELGLAELRYEHEQERMKQERLLGWGGGVVKAIFNR